MTDNWLAIGFSRRTGLSLPAKSNSHSASTKAEVNRFRVIARGERVTNHVDRALCFVGGQHFAGRNRRTCGDLFEAVDARDFFRSGSSSISISKRYDGRHHRERIVVAFENVQAEAREDLRNFVRVDLDADECGFARETRIFTGSRFGTLTI